MGYSLRNLNIYWDIMTLKNSNRKFKSQITRLEVSKFPIFYECMAVKLNKIKSVFNAT